MSLTCQEFILSLKQRMVNPQSQGRFEKIFRCSHLPNKFFLITTIGHGYGSTEGLIIDAINISRDAYDKTSDGVKLTQNYMYVDMFTQTPENPIISDYESIPVDAYVTGEQAAMFRVIELCDDLQLVRKLSSFADKAHLKLVHVTKEDFVFCNPDAHGLREPSLDAGAIFAAEGFQQDFADMAFQVNDSTSSAVFSIRSASGHRARNFIPVYIPTYAQEEQVGNMQVANLLASYLTEKEHCTLLKLLQREQATHPCATVHDLLRKVYPTYDVALVPSKTEPLLASNS